jgi:hypothetical protein
VFLKLVCQLKIEEIAALSLNDGDKPGLAAVVLLTRPRDGIVVNPYYLGREILSRALDLRVHFTDGAR